VPALRLAEALPLAVALPVRVIDGVIVALEDADGGAGPPPPSPPPALSVQLAPNQPSWQEHSPSAHTPR